MKIKEVTIDGDIAFVPLTKGFVSIIDSADAELVGQFNWYARTGIRETPYAIRVDQRGEKNLHIGLHRMLLNPPKGLHVDHVDGNGLNNRRSNLRVATPAENQRNRGLHINNTSGYKGVGWDKQRGKWLAQIELSGKTTRLGRYATKELAHAAYCEAAKMHFGQFANFGNSSYQEDAQAMADWLATCRKGGQS